MSDPSIHLSDFSAYVSDKETADREPCPCTSMHTPFFKNMDSLGMGVSSLCAVHCFLMPFVIAGLSMVGLHFIQHDATHMVLAFFVLFFCLMAVIPGYRRHGNKMVVATMCSGLSLVMFGTFLAESIFGEPGEFPIMMLGNALVITAHVLNRKYISLADATSTNHKSRSEVKS
jgi:MerC mercury resistance protein